MYVKDDTGNSGDLYESAFSRVYAEIRRIDELRQADALADKQLNEERTRRLDQRMDAMETAVTAALNASEKANAAAASASEKAIIKAETAQQKVNDTQNEFRGTLRDQAQQLMPRAETENLIRELRGLITSVNAEVTTLRSRIDVGPPTLASLQSRSDELQGQRRGSLDARTLVFSLIAASVGVIGIVLAIVSATTH